MATDYGLIDRVANITFTLSQEKAEQIISFLCNPNAILHSSIHFFQISALYF